jgi:hypothetical protein
MSAILNDQPFDLTVANPDLSPTVVRIVHRCLEKQPDNRFQTAKDLAFAIESVSSLSTSAAQAIREHKQRSWLGRPAWLAGLAAASLLALGAGFTLGRLRDSRAPQPTVRLLVAPSHGYRLRDRADTFAISPDGRNLAICEQGTTNTHLAIRPLATLESRPIPDSSAAKDLFWSPDGRFIGFFDGLNLKTVSLEGGRPTALCRARGSGGTWNQNGVIVFSEFFGGGLFRVSASGGEPVPLTTLDAGQGEDSHLWPRFLPDGNHFLFLATIRREKGIIRLGSLDSNQTRPVMAADALIGYAAPGYLLFARGGTLYGQGFNPRTLTLAGEPFIILEQIA